jgi:chromosome segregation ATPase
VQQLEQRLEHVLQGFEQTKAQVAAREERCRQRQQVEDALRKELRQEADRRQALERSVASLSDQARRLQADAQQGRAARSGVVATPAPAGGGCSCNHNVNIRIEGVTGNVVFHVSGDAEVDVATEDASKVRVQPPVRTVRPPAGLPQPAPQVSPRVAPQPPVGPAEPRRKINEPAETSAPAAEPKKKID